MHFSSTKHGSGSPILTTPQRRAAPRFSVNWRARVLIEANQFSDAKVIDIAEGGMGMHCFVRLREAKSYDFAVAVPIPSERDRLQVIQVHGLVTSCILANDRFRVGVQFLKIEAPAKELIRQWLRGTPEA